MIPDDGCSLLSYQTAKEPNLIKKLNSLSSVPTNRTAADELPKEALGQDDINLDVQPMFHPHQRCFSIEGLACNTSM